MSHAEKQLRDVNSSNEILVSPSLFKKDEDDKERTDQPRESIEWYLQKRLPKGEKQLPIERYFQAKEKIKRMKRFSTPATRTCRRRLKTDAEK